MANPNALIVEVVGDTTRLTKGLKDAERQLSRFAGRSKIRSTGADALLGDVRGLEKQAATLAKTQAEVSAQSDILNSRLATTGVKAGIAGLALYAVGRNMSELGGTAGKLGQAFSDLSTGNIVGFVKSLQSINEADPKQIAADLLKYGDAAKASAAANAYAAAGFDTMAAAASAAAGQIRAATDAFVDNTKIRDSTSPGAIAAQTSGLPLPKKYVRQPLTAGQRRSFFDSRIARELDRVQDVKGIAAQTAALRKIAAEVQKRHDATKDVTRRLNLEDQLAGINRRIGGLQKSAADAVADRLKREREARAKALAKIKAEAQKLKQQAEDIRSAVLDAFDTRQDKVHNARGLADAQEALRIARQEGGPVGIRDALRNLQDAQANVQRTRLETMPFTVTAGPKGPVNTLHVGNLTINVNGAGDPKAVAKAVLNEIQKANKRGSAQSRGTVAGRNFNAGVY